MNAKEVQDVVLGGQSYKVNFTEPAVGFLLVNKDGHVMLSDRDIDRIAEAVMTKLADCGFVYRADD